jgi:hypothetical protein
MGHENTSIDIGLAGPNNWPNRHEGTQASPDSAWSAHSASLTCFSLRARAHCQMHRYPYKETSPCPWQLAGYIADKSRNEASSTYLWLAPGRVQLEYSTRLWKQQSGQAATSQICTHGRLQLVHGIIASIELLVQDSAHPWRRRLWNMIPFFVFNLTISRRSVEKCLWNNLFCYCFHVLLDRYALRGDAYDDFDGC